jgi:HNH endonuclease
MSRTGQIPSSTPEPEYTRLKAEYILSNVMTNERGCLEYRGYRHPKGYGQVGMKVGNEATHRVVYRGKRGPIPDGWDVCHTCDNPPCCNPLHLFAAPRVANLIDMRNKGRNRQTQKTHCPQGHSYAEHGGVHSTRPTWRICLACARDKTRRDQANGSALARQRRYRARKKAEGLQMGKT